MESMKYVLHSVLAGSLALIAYPAMANNPMTDLVSLSGSCSGIMLYGKSVESKCKAAMNTLYKDGRSGFYFIADNMILTFSGNGDLQVRKDPNTSSQAIDLVLFNNPEAGGDPSKPDKLIAIGKCLFENPFQGRPTQLICKATTERGDFEATFNHDGSEPSILIQNGRNMMK